MSGWQGTFGKVGNRSPLRNIPASRMATRRPLVVEFTKMHGAGNDFVVLDNRFFHFSGEELSAFAARYCDRHEGIGADGLLAFARPENDEHDFRMIYYNADGSRATLCGNGARCLVRYARNAGLDAELLRFETDAGVLSARTPDDQVRLYLEPARDLRPLTPTHAEVPVEVTYVWTGTEHLVGFVDDVEAAEVEAWGASLRYDPAVEPPGANANFVEVTGPASLRVRTYERGVEAETRACGTGAIAAAVVALETDRVEEGPVAVQMAGGTLRVGFESVEGGEGLFLEGPAHFVFRGSFEWVPNS